MTGLPLPSAEVLRPSKSFSAHNLLQDTKDYFQVTDELAQENSHLRLSEALLAVIEQYKATCLEQRVCEEQLALSSSLPLLASSPLSTPPPPPPQFSSSPSTPGELSSWSSMNSIATTTDGTQSWGGGGHDPCVIALNCRACGWASSTEHDSCQPVGAHAVSLVRSLCRVHSSEAAPVHGRTHVKHPEEGHVSVGVCVCVCACACVCVCMYVCMCSFDMLVLIFFCSQSSCQLISSFLYKPMKIFRSLLPR